MQTNGLKKRILVVAITAALISSSAMVIAAEQTATSIPAGVGGEYYTLGGGSVLPPPGSGRITFNIRARLQLGFGYSCGKFNFQNNISQMINQFRQRVRQLPGQLQQAAQAAVAGLPGYLMQKYNPTLYNILTKTLDESAELFNMSYKSCEQMEAEMAKDPNANPYDGFLRASIAQKWTIGGNANNAIAADVHQDVKTNPAAPIRWIGGVLYGTALTPIQINHDLAVAGYNIMLNRTGDVSTNARPTGNLANERIARIWPTPREAGVWAQKVVGDKRVVLIGANQNRETIPGKGLRPIMVELRTEIQEAVRLAYEENNYSGFNNYATVKVTPALIEGIKALPVSQRGFMRDRMIEEMAVKETIERAFLIVQMISIGLQEPDVSSSTGASIADEYVRNNTIPAFQSRIEEVLQDIELSQSTIDGTTRTIINQSQGLGSFVRGKE